MQVSKDIPVLVMMLPFNGKTGRENTALLRAVNNVVVFTDSPDFNLNIIMYTAIMLPLLSSVT